MKIQMALIVVLFGLTAGMPQQSAAADADDLPEDALYERYRTVCAQNRADRELSVMMGCVILSQDPEGTRAEISSVRDMPCEKLDDRCGARAAEKPRLLPIAESMVCGSAAASCGGTGTTLVRHWELCDGQLSLGPLIIRSTGHLVVRFLYRDGSMLFINGGWMVEDLRQRGDQTMTTKVSVNPKSPAYRKEA